MHRFRGSLVLSTVLLIPISATGCSSNGPDGGEHSGEHGSEGREESGTQLSLTDTYDNTRNGARLILRYDAESHSFKGTVENTTEKILESVRVEVHLSNGKELGPTEPGDLAPRATREVTLVAESMGFDGWSAHPEVGNEEHGEGGEHGGESRGEHDREGDGEHGGEREREGGEHR